MLEHPGGLRPTEARRMLRPRPIPLPEAAMGDNWFKWLNRSRLSPQDPFLQH